MKVSFTYPARILNPETGREDFIPYGARRLQSQESELAEHLDAEIADEGIVGGTITINLLGNRPTVTLSYWCPGTPTSALVASLREDTVAQLEDGIGEGGFEYHSEGKMWLIVADADSPADVDVQDDGRVVPGRPEIQIAARNGELSLLARLLASTPQEIVRQHQGCSALHLAILFGHKDAVPMLLNAGANPNQLDSQGQTALEVCALSRDLSDEQSREVARMLLGAGCNPQHQTPNGESAKSYAELRGKKLLAAIL